MSMANDDNEVSLKLQRLKKWMKEKRLPRGFQQTAMGAKNGTFLSFPYVCPEPVLAK
jgi:hypothetical protein